MVACVMVPLALGFNGLLRKPRTFVQEICQREIAGGRLLTPVTTNIDFNWGSCSARGMIAVNRISIHGMIFGRSFCDPISHYFNVSSSAHVIISGFWVGPDIEDGWGFVEAFVHRIY
ncbi:unnamed protein product [Coffea canephora]|uniref:Uncharacterized protein n=1 Tax=Coffea canephora TaxID=49390 RepID=A0A068V4J4_COFCA|nr:uncharacterized protein LOC113727635 isoform X1 [Coffea arabica]XP_027114651.1 uncharacterized protein LOC113732848 isoform X1 [Coffea arabica]CDP15497.1 unnamed protein product [Coffea canephora]